MLKQSNKILVGCLALLLVLSVGYALFSDTITINGTATAKGDFSYEITTMKGIDAEVKTSDMYATMMNYGTTGAEMDFGSEEGVEISSISNTANTITYSASLTNSGQSQYFTAKITNTGSIPIVLDIYYDFEENATLSGNLIMSDGTLFDVNKVINATQGGEGYEYGFTASDIGSVATLRQTLTSLQDIYVSKKAFDELESDPEAIPKLEIGESVYLVFLSWWPENESFCKNVIGIDVTGSNTITIPIKQVTIN